MGLERLEEGMGDELQMRSGTTAKIDITQTEQNVVLFYPTSSSRYFRGRSTDNADIQALDMRILLLSPSSFHFDGKASVSSVVNVYVLATSTDQHFLAHPQRFSIFQQFRPDHHILLIEASD